MECPTCASSMVAFGVPERYRDHLPRGSPVAAICPTCLTLAVPDGVVGEVEVPPEPAFDRVGQAFPTDEAAAVPMAIAIGLLDSLALNRRAIEELLEAVEAEGTDPLLVLDRLDAQGGTQPAIDLERRRHQVRQLLG